MEKPTECKGCPLEQKGISFSIPDGRGTRNIAIIGESLGDQESRDGLPFRPKAASGSKLEECFKLAGADLLEPVSRSDFLLMNLIQCQPPANLLDGMPWENGAIDHCKVHFDSYISKVSSNSQRVILACGNLPLKNLTSASGIAKEKQSISHLRGYVFRGPYGYVVPCFHPSYLRRGKPNYTPLLVDDIKKAIAVANGEFVHRWHPDYKKPDYNENPSLEDAKSFLQMVRDNPNKILSYDIETENSAATEEDEREDDITDITQIQFSLSRGTGISLGFNRLFETVIRALLSTSNTKANHNTWNFDNKLLCSKGFQINGKIHDTMWMFKHYQPNLPRGLQSVARAAGFPFPWKHLYGSRLAYYGAADVDAVQYILGWLPPIMKKMGIWQGYYDHVFRLYSPTLLRASEKGIPVNETARQDLYTPSRTSDTGAIEPATGVFEESRLRIDTELQGLIPDELRNIKPKRKSKSGEIDFGYIRDPPKVKQLATKYEQLRKEYYEKNGTQPKVSFGDLVFKKLGLQKASFQRPLVQLALDGAEFETIERWCKLEPFKPSFDQVARYIRWKKKTLENSDLKDERNLSKFYEIPKIPKVDKITGDRVDKDTTGKKVLEDLFYETGDRVLEAVLELRSVSTTITNFIPGWKPAKDGSVHTEWGFTAASGQLNSRRPNILNCSKRSDNGQRFRRIIEAPKGYTFVEFDYKSFHVATMGYEANSRNYIRFSQIDPHSIFASHIMPREWGPPVDMRDSDDAIKEYCSFIKKRCKTSDIDYRQLAKVPVLGNQLCLGPRKMYMQNRRLIASVNQAKELQAMLAEPFPEIGRTQDAIKKKAHEYPHYLTNEWGYIQWFWDVYQWKWNHKAGIWKKHNGTDAEKTVAFKVQGGAFGILKWNLLEAEKRELTILHNFINTIHDSVIFMPEIKRLKECVRDIYKLFSRACPIMVNQATGPEGLQVGLEISIGQNWQSKDFFGKDDNPEGMSEISTKEMKEEYGI